MRKNITLLLIFALTIPLGFISVGQNFMTNIQGRKITNLNGQWQAIIDQFDRGIEKSNIWKDAKPKGKTDFYEYSFDGGLVLNVPGDWNSQKPELKYYEGVIWYKKSFMASNTGDKRQFLYFGAVNYKADVFVNNKKVGSHEGGFTPFQFEVTGQLKDGENSIIVRVNNQRVSDGIPALSFDWWNYGGITRDVSLIETPGTFINDYFVQLEKGSSKAVKGWVKLAGSQLEQSVRITIPEAKIEYRVKTDKQGMAELHFPAKLALWSPSNPKTYRVRISCETDTISEEIGFRSIEVKGNDILLNGEPVFLKGINFHEEIAQRSGRAFSDGDAVVLLSAAKELGCNFIRLTHYPQSEPLVKLAEKMGFMMWEEIPIWQGIDFNNPVILKKTETMLVEMIERDKNRAGIIIWSMSNETAPSQKRNETIINMTRISRKMDPTRLITSAFDKVKYEGNTITIDDTLSNYLDVLAVNEYLGWYKAWPAKPNEVKWKSDFNKPLIMSEFGAEALFGNHKNGDLASSWSEEYQANLYRDQLEMFRNIPFMKGTCPWVLFDFRSPFRMHPTYQDGWNRKGLISDQGFKKKAWYVMKDYYSSFK